MKKKDQKFLLLKFLHENPQDLMYQSKYHDYKFLRISFSYHHIFLDAIKGQPYKYMLENMILLIN